MMRKRLAGALVAMALVGGTPAVVDAAPRGLDGPRATAAKSCSRGTHAVIGGEHKCLARGQFCARSQERAYHRYGYHCHKRDRNGRYHLS